MDLNAIGFYSLALHANIYHKKNIFCIHTKINIAKAK